MQGHLPQIQGQTKGQRDTIWKWPEEVPDLLNIHTVGRRPMSMLSLSVETQTTNIKTQKSISQGQRYQENMRCLISNCLHNSSPKSQPNGTCWALWQICPCCAMELIHMQSIQYPASIKPPVLMERCKRFIKQELSK